MKKIYIKPGWASKMGGPGTDYYYSIWDKEDRKPYLDGNYWYRFNRWFEQTYHCKVKGTHGPNTVNTSEFVETEKWLEFENDEDATFYLLRWS